MVKSVLIILLLLFAVSGICDLIFFLRMRLFSPNSQTKCYATVFLKKNHALEQLRYLWEKMRWYGNDFAVSIIAFIDEINMDELEDCRRFCLGKNIILTAFEEKNFEWKTLS